MQSLTQVMMGAGNSIYQGGHSRHHEKITQLPFESKSLDFLSLPYNLYGLN